MTHPSRLARFGPSPVLRDDARDALGAALLATAESTGLFVAATPASELPCGEPDCPGRRVVRVGPGRPLVVCGRADGGCDDVQVAHERVARIAFVEGAFAALLARVTRAVGGVERLPSGSYALGSRGDERVYWMRGPTLGAEVAPGACLVIADAEDLPLAARLRGVRAMGVDDVVRLSKGKLVAGVVSPRETAKVLPLSAARAREATYPLPASWADLRLTVIDGHTLEVRVGNKRARATYAELGMAHARTKDPDRSWNLLVLFCNDGGVLPKHEVGNASGTAREAVSKLRGKLRAAFRLSGDPIVAGRGGWKAAFAVTAQERKERGESSW